MLFLFYYGVYSAQHGPLHLGGTHQTISRLDIGNKLLQWNYILNSYIKLIGYLYREAIQGCWTQNAQAVPIIFPTLFMLTCTPSSIAALYSMVYLSYQSLEYNLENIFVSSILFCHCISHAPGFISSTSVVKTWVPFLPLSAIAQNLRSFLGWLS